LDKATRRIFALTTKTKRERNMTEGPMDKITRKMSVNIKINESRSREEVLSTELAQLLDREETWDQRDVQHAQRLEEMIRAEKGQQGKLRQELEVIDRENK
jgi:hypothetical protein